MDGFSFKQELKSSSEMIEQDDSAQMKKILQELTTTGCNSLDASVSKKFKKLCRNSDNHVRYAFYLIMAQLTKNHAEIRLSASQIADELFNRSHAFRELMVNHLNEFLALTTGTEASKPLPPPKPAALKMTTDTLKTIQQWCDKYGQGYRKLIMGFEYLKNCKHIDFNDIRARSLAEQKRIEEEEKKKQKMMALRLSNVLKEISETKDEIQMSAKEAESCLQLLMPTPDDFLQNFSDNNECSHSNLQTTSSVNSETLDPDPGSQTQVNEDKATISENSENDHMGIDDGDDDSDDDESMEDVDVDLRKDMQLHGLPGQDQSIVVDLGQSSVVTVHETKDNTDVVQSLKEASKIISSNYLPKVTLWLETLCKNGAKEEDIKFVIDLKVHLKSIKQKCVDLKLVTMENSQKSKTESDEDDFEDVPEKEGYEPHIPPHLRKEYGLEEIQSSEKIDDKASSSKANTLETASSSKSACEKTWYWNLKEKLKSEDTADPTSLAAAMAHIRPDRLKKENSTESSQETQKDHNGSSVPVVPYDVDLAYWENPDEMEAPSILKFDSLHRFWNPKEFESEKPSKHDQCAMRSRVFSYTGTFEPVKWKCRAPMANGKLCERMDRIKCPFHGNVVPRDEQGKQQAMDSASSSKTSDDLPGESSGSKESKELPPWKDPELQREIEQATGKDLGSARSQKELDKKSKGKGKGKGKKSSNLTDINASKNTARRRIENRIFNKRSVRRVCSTLDSADYRRVRDKFGNQFNYSLH